MSASRSSLGLKSSFLIGGSLGLYLGALLHRIYFSPSSPSVRMEEEASRELVICFGDSLTQYGFNVHENGWSAQLQHLFQRRLDVVNRGFGGYTSRWGLKMAPKILAPTPKGSNRKVRLITLFWGANDAVIAGALQHVPVEEFKANMHAIISIARANHPQAALLLLTPPPFHAGKWIEHREAQGQTTERDLPRAESIVQAVREVGAEASVTVVDVYSALGSGEQEQAFLHTTDGVHLSASGNDKVFAAVSTAIFQTFPALDPEKLPMQAPHWSKVDTENLDTLYNEL